MQAVQEMPERDAEGRLIELLPNGYPATACKIAGAKRPRAWSVG